MVGTRGVPAAYGGFETAVEEVGRRLVDLGHEVVVYCRGAEDPEQTEFLGMELVHLPAVKRKSLETLSHTAVSARHLRRTGEGADVAVVFNAANAPFVPGLRRAGIPVAVHVDGLESRRAKWGGAGRRYYRLAESLSVRWADALIADAQGIADYYREEFGAPTELIRYGAPIQEQPGHDRIAELDLTPGGYHLVVARFEPENHVLEIVQGYAASSAERPLVVVGSAPYADDYTAAVSAVADPDPRIRMLGGVWDQELLDELYAQALVYLHGHSVGGTNPSLLRAMGAGSAVAAYDVVFNREVLGEHGRFFDSPAALAGLLADLEADAEGTRARGALLRERAREEYRWDDVAAGYEQLLERLAKEGVRRRPRSERLSGRRSGSSRS